MLSEDTSTWLNRDVPVERLASSTRAKRGYGGKMPKNQRRRVYSGGDLSAEKSPAARTPRADKKKERRPTQPGHPPQSVSTAGGEVKQLYLISRADLARVKGGGIENVISHAPRRSVHQLLTAIALCFRDGYLPGTRSWVAVAASRSLA